MAIGIRGRCARVMGRALLAALLAFTLGSPVAARAADLTIGLNVTPTSMDPHFHYVSQNTSPL